MLGLHRNLAAIARSSTPPPRQLAATYLGLRIRKAAGRRPPLARLLDWQVAYTDFGALVNLYAEVFVRQQYPFRPRRPQPFVVDCGANVGVAALYFKTVAPDADVLAFEPEPAAFALLTGNVRRNGLAGSVECVRAALAAEPGGATLHVPAPAHGGASLVFHGEGWSPVEVETVRLSDRLGDRPVDFLKLDVEGAEHAIVAELAASGALAQVAELAIEHHPRRPGDLPALLATLADAGFEYRLAVAGDAFWEPQQLLLVHAFRPG